MFTSAYSTVYGKALWFANILKDSRSYPQNSQRKKNLFIKQYWLLNSWPLFFFACCSWYPYSREGIHFCSPKGELDFFCFTHSLISLSMGSATAGQILGHHMGLIFVFLQLIGCLFKSFGTLKCYKVEDTCSCNCLLIMASSIPKSQIKKIHSNYTFLGVWKLARLHLANKSHCIIKAVAFFGKVDFGASMSEITHSVNTIPMFLKQYITFESVWLQLSNGYERQGHCW